jgi:hypothetical protein
MFRFKEFIILHEKVVGTKNAGIEDEARVAKILRQQGVMRGKSAGSTNKSDLNISRPGQKPIHGEHKQNKAKAAFGQIAIHKHPETGHWYIPDKSREKNPEFAKHVENAKITVTDKGKTEVRNLLQHMNKTQSHDYTKPEGRKTADDVYSDHTDLSPVHAYMRGHGNQLKQPQHFLHISTHGTYRAGDSEHHDVHGLGFPSIKGTGRFRIRQKKAENPNIRTAQFDLRHIEPSTHNLEHPTEIGRVKRILGINTPVQSPRLTKTTKKDAGSIIKRPTPAKSQD